MCVIAAVFATSTHADASTKSQDTATAKAGVLRLNDFEAGWRKVPHESNTAETDEAMATLPSCKTWLAVRKRTRKLPHVWSSDFGEGRRRGEQRGLRVPTEQQASEILRTFGSGRTLTCVRSYTRKSVEARASVNPQIDGVTTTIGEESVEPIGDDVVAYTVEFKVTTESGFSDELFLEAQAVRVGRALDVFSFESDIDDYPLSSIAPGVMDTSVERIGAASG